MIGGDSSWLDTLGRHKSYLALLAAAAACTFVATPLYARLALARGWVDRPGGRKAHDRPMPTMGGLVVFAAVFAGAAVTLAWGNRVSEMLREHVTYVLGAIGCTTLMIAVGVLDDLRGLRVKLKFAAQLGVALLAYFIGFQVREITLPGVGSAPLGGTSFLLTLIWIVAVINAVNFTDGLDGLAAGVCFLAAGVNAGVAIWLGNYYMAVMMLLLAGALLGFLRWNFHPARVFLGDAGSLGLGTFLALCSLHSAQKSHTVVMILVPLCALGYPIFDLLLAVARRTLRGQPPWTSDRDHIHHRLLARGHTPARTAGLIYAGSLGLIVVCLLAMSANHLVVGLALVGVLGLAVFSVRVLGYLEWAGWDERRETKVLHAAAQLARLKMAAAENADEILAALSVFAGEAGYKAMHLREGQRERSWQPAMRAQVGASKSQDLRIELGGGTTLTIEADGGVLNDAARRALMDELCRLATDKLGGPATTAVDGAADGKTKVESRNEQTLR